MPSRMDIVAATYAENVTSPAFRDALDEAYRRFPDDYAEEAGIAEDIIFSALRNPPESFTPAFEMKRQAAIGALAGNGWSKSPFYKKYFLELPGAHGATIDAATQPDTGTAHPEAIATNSRILAANTELADPNTFFQTALHLISERKSVSQHAVGPENYATSIKFFADKLVESPDALTEEQKNTAANSLVRWFEGYKSVAKKDTPNYVEVTNVAAAIQRIPRDLLPEGLTPVFVKQALEVLPSLTSRSTQAILNAASRLVAQEAPTELSVLVNLGIHMLGQLPDSNALRSGLRAIANLPPSKLANETFGTLLANSHGMVKSMNDLSRMLEIATTFRRIANHTVQDPALLMLAKQQVEDCAQKAVGLFKSLEASPDSDEQELRTFQDITRKIVVLYQQM